MRTVFSRPELKDFSRANPNRKFKLVLLDRSIEESDRYEEKILKLVYPRITHMDFNIGLALHLASKGEGYIFDDPEKKVAESLEKSNR